MAPKIAQLQPNKTNHKNNNNNNNNNSSRKERNNMGENAYDISIYVQIDIEHDKISCWFRTL